MGARTEGISLHPCIIQALTLQVMYPFRWARLVHHVPLLLTLSLPFIQRSGFKQQASLPQLYASLAGEALAALLSMVGALASCLLVSVLRVALLGQLPLNYPAKKWHGIYSRE